MYAGDARFWKTIDDSFDQSEVEKIQKYLGDEEPTAFEVRPSKVEFEYDREGNIKDLNPKL